MKYCVPFYRDFKYNDKVNEIILYYHNHDDNMLNFILNNYDNSIRIIIDIRGKEGEIDLILPVINKIKQEHDNIVVRMNADAGVGYLKLKDLNIPYFFWNKCYNLEEVYTFISKGVSDVYVFGELGFNLQEIGKFCHTKNVNVRVIPNVCQCSYYCSNAVPASCKFFIRPEDTDIYEDYVDIFEFAGDINRINTVFGIYLSKIWVGELKYLIEGFDESFINSNATSFGKYRLNCQHKCMYDKCNICTSIKDISTEVNNFVVKIKDI